jgi:CDP-diacylglycerol--serine O-phosphatidyltransferase
MLVFQDMRLRKALFVLPNLFTVSSIFCGFYACTLVSAGESHPDRYYQAALSILFAIFFDAFDGRVARLTKTQSEFGMQLDSLADVISFGVAPALLLYKWALQPLGFWGLLLAFLFTACGALRLARFNVLTNRHKGAAAFFIGLPIPLAAGTVISLVIANGRHGSPMPALPMAAVALGLSYLMVSNVRYRTFKETRLSRSKGLLLLLMASAAVFFAISRQPAMALVLAMAAYILLGLAEGGLGVGRRIAERRRAGALADAGELEEDDSEDFA